MIDIRTAPSELHSEAGSACRTSSGVARLRWLSCAVHQHLRCAPADVVAYVADATQYPRWLGLMLDTHEVVAPRPGADGHFTAVWRHLGRDVELAYRVHLQEVPLRLVVRTPEGSFPHSWTFAFSLRPDGTDLAVTLKGHLVGALERQLSTNLYALKTLLERPEAGAARLMAPPE